MFATLKRLRVKRKEVSMYTSLPLNEPRDIRLLDMGYGDMSSFSTASITLQTVSLDTAPFYVALSYPWVTSSRQLASLKTMLTTP
jgi:hypothetical protein